MYFIVFTVCLSGFLFGYYMAIISGAVTLISCDFHFSLHEESAFVSFTLLGAALGSFMGGFLTKTLGRKKVFWLTCLLLFLGCLILLKTSLFHVLLGARIFQGVGIGIISVVAPLYLGEISPIEHRGKIVSTYQLMITVGILTAWFFEKKQKDLGMQMLENIFQQVTGINSVVCYAPRIFKEAGYRSSADAVFATIGLGIAALIIAIFSIWLVDRVGRKRLLLISISGMMLSLFCFSVLPFYQVSSIETVSFTLLVVYRMFFSLGLGPVTWVLLSEIYPIKIRDREMASSLLVNWLGFFFVLWTFPYLLAWIKIPGTFGLYALINLLALVFVYKCIPETKKKSFQEIFNLFDKKVK